MGLKIKLLVHFKCKAGAKIDNVHGTKEEMQSTENL